MDFLNWIGLNEWSSRLTRGMEVVSALGKRVRG